MRRTLTTRLNKVSGQHEPAIDPQVRAFAQSVIRYGGHEPTSGAIEHLARWYTGGYRQRSLDAY